MNQQPDTTTLEGKIALMQAAKDGKRIEFRPVGTVPNYWKLLVDVNSYNWSWYSFEFRIHPDDLNPKKYRAWKPEEVPVGALIRDKDTYFGSRPHALILSGRGVYVHYFCPVYAKLTDKPAEVLLKEKWEHSTDNGKTWQPCGVLE